MVNIYGVITLLQVTTQSVRKQRRLERKSKLTADKGQDCKGNDLLWNIGSPSWYFKLRMT